MAAKVKLKERCCLFFVIFVTYVNGMFVHRHCSHVHPKPDEVRKQQNYCQKSLTVLKYFFEADDISEVLSLPDILCSRC
jgi:hypothetical protein